MTADRGWRAGALRDLAAAAAIAAGYVALVWSSPARRLFELDPDEGGHAMKALLLARGYSLYGEIWSDQPPLFTVLLRAWFELFGWDVEAGRALVVACAALLIFVVYDLTRRFAGHLAAVAAIALLCATAYIRVLSVALMIGLPSLAFAMASLWALICWQRRGPAVWWMASAVLLGAALAIKLMTGLVAPLALLSIAILGRPGQGRGARLRVALGWAALSAATWALLVLPWTGVDGLAHLARTHLAARAAFDPLASRVVLRRGLSADAWFFALAAFGAWRIVRLRAWPLLLLPAWSLGALLLLRLHTPVWYHYHLLLTVPLAPLAGLAVAAALTPNLRPPSLAARATIIALTAGVLVPVLTGRKADPFSPERHGAGADRVVALMSSLHDRTHRVVADMPIYAFRAGDEVPPLLAVVSMKRIAAGELDAATFAAAIADGAPELVVLTDRLPPAMQDGVLAAVSTDYRLLLRTEPPRPVRLFVRADVLAELASPRSR